MDFWYSIGLDYGSGDDVTVVVTHGLNPYRDRAEVVDMIRPGRVIEGECVRISPEKTDA
jgi:hypothetical protein